MGDIVFNTKVARRAKITARLFLERYSRPEAMQIVTLFRAGAAKRRETVRADFWQMVLDEFEKRQALVRK